MRWSKLKQLVEARMAPSVQGRVRCYVARYPEAHDGDGRAWIAVDKREIVSFCDYAWINERYRLGREYAATHGDRADAAAISRLAAEGVFSHYQFVNALEAYLSLPITEAIVSDNGIVRALAILDGRVGKRRLRALRLEPDATAFVRALFELRCEVEGIVPGSASSNPIDSPAS